MAGRAWFESARRWREPLEAVIAVAVVLQRFRISSDRDTVPLDSAGITLRPKGAVTIRLARPRRPRGRKP